MLVNSVIFSITWKKEVSLVGEGSVPNFNKACDQSMCSFAEPMKGLGSPPVSVGQEGQSDKANLLIGEFH